jgi:hypothetical protein
LLAVCAELPDEYVALRVPITGADDPTSVSLMAAVALSQALNDIDMEGHQQQALEASRADGRSAERASGGGGGTLGGGPIPIAIHAEVNTLRETHVTDALATDRLAGLDRLISILVARDRRPVFVLEDTEAAIGGASREETAEAFLAGPVHAFVHEIDAACLIAIQDVFTTVPSFKELATSMALVDIPAPGMSVEPSTTGSAVFRINPIAHERRARPLRALTVAKGCQCLCHASAVGEAEIGVELQQGDEDEAAGRCLAVREGEAVGLQL